MKNITMFILLLIFFSSCNKDELYFNVEMKIVKINSDCSLSEDKFHNPQTCNTVLLETINEPKLYVELNDCRERRITRKLKVIETKWWYNHQVGDTVHFDYIRKDRFFEIK